MLSGVVEVLRFGSWVKIFHGTGGSRCCPFSTLTVEGMQSNNKLSKDTLAYFRELAEGAALKTNEGDSLLAMKYRHLDFISQRSILFSFLQAISPSSKLIPPDLTSDLIFPFGCNMSQKTAAQRALQHPVSLVKGPPGTGKTQTILNLIANMLLQKKRVAVVSNNNSATANVLEKLKKYGLDFCDRISRQQRKQNSVHRWTDRCSHSNAEASRKPGSFCA